MPTPPIPDTEQDKMVAAWLAAPESERYVAALAVRFGRDRATVNKILRARGVISGRRRGVNTATASAALRAACGAPAAPGPNFEAGLQALRKGPTALDRLAAAIGCTKGRALDWIDELKGKSHNVREVDGTYALERDIEPSWVGGRAIEYRSRGDDTFVFGAMGDTHLGSRYARIDCLNRLYDRYAAEGVDRVFHTGNWIEGEAPFNKYELDVVGMDRQCQFLAAVYPKKPGIHTYAVAGDDHEGWYAKREGINIGRHAESIMRDAGRGDWHDLGYMEAHVALVNARTGKSATLAVVHPGGGSAYALSYSIQKIVESYEGGEKPGVGLYGHYHKLWSGNIRNVCVVQTGCLQDQTSFMRKKRLEAHVGGYIIRLKQDPETGAIVEMTATMLRYFNRSFYNDRWSHSGAVVLPARD